MESLAHLCGLTQACNAGQCTTECNGDPATRAAPLFPELEELASTWAPAGAVKQGGVLTVKLEQGDSFTTQLQLKAGGCYTIVSVGDSSIVELNISLQAVTPIPGSQDVLAMDQDSGREAVIGKKPNCYKNPAPFDLPVTLQIEAPGAIACGFVAAQVYGVME